MIPMGVSKEEVFLGRVDQVDEAMCDISFSLSAIEWAANKRVDSATKRDLARVPISSIVVPPCSRCLVYKRSPSLHKGKFVVFSDS